MKKSGKYISPKELHYLEYLNRETDFSHHPYDEDILQYEYLKAGNPLALEEAKKMCTLNQSFSAWIIFIII